MKSNRPYVQLDPAVIEQARQMDLLSYLQRHEPDNLKHVARNIYCTREHDSLKISNGKWYWWSRGFGGVSALDYLIKVKEYSFVEAVEVLAGITAGWSPPPVSAPKEEPNCREMRKRSCLQRRRKFRRCGKTKTIYGWKQLYLWIRCSILLKMDKRKPEDFYSSGSFAIHNPFTVASITDSSLSLSLSSCASKRLRAELFFTSFSGNMYSSTDTSNMVIS